VAGSGTGHGPAAGMEPGRRTASTSLYGVGRQLSGPAYVSIELPFDTTVASVARKEVVSLLGDTEEVTDSVSLVCSELVTNAFRHGSPPILLKVRVDPEEAEPAIEITVTDGGAPRRSDPDSEPDSSDESGRGHLIVDALALGSSLEVGCAGTRAWCRLPIPAQPAPSPSLVPGPSKE
jgi:anti-sigma regulatory factor (Ser/Thr protein kinase)